MERLRVDLCPCPSHPIASFHTRHITMKSNHVLIVILSLLCLPGCTSSPGGGTTETDIGDHPPSTSDLTPDRSSNSGEIVLYCGRSKSLVSPIIAQFEKQSQITVQVRYANTGELAATLIEEGEDSPADLFWAQDSGSLGAVSAAELLGTLPDDVISSVPESFHLCCCS